MRTRITLLIIVFLVGILYTFREKVIRLIDLPDFITHPYSHMNQSASNDISSLTNEQILPLFRDKTKQLSTLSLEEYKTRDRSYIEYLTDDYKEKYAEFLNSQFYNDRYPIAPKMIENMLKDLEENTFLVTSKSQAPFSDNIYKIILSEQTQEEHYSGGYEIYILEKNGEFELFNTAFNNFIERYDDIIFEEKISDVIRELDEDIKNDENIAYAQIFYDTTFGKEIRISILPSDVQKFTATYSLVYKIIGKIERAVDENAGDIKRGYIGETKLKYSIWIYDPKDGARDIAEGVREGSYGEMLTTGEKENKEPYINWLNETTVPDIYKKPKNIGATASIKIDQPVETDKTPNSQGFTRSEKASEIIIPEIISNILKPYIADEAIEDVVVTKYTPESLDMDIIFENGDPYAYMRVYSFLHEMITKIKTVNSYDTKPVYNSPSFPESGKVNYAVRVLNHDGVVLLRANKKAIDSTVSFVTQ